MFQTSGKRRVLKVGAALATCLMLMLAVLPASFVAASTLDSVAVDPQGAPIVPGGTATFNVPVTMGGTSNRGVMLDVTTTLPSGVTASFSVGGSCRVSNGNNWTSTLSLDTTAGTPAGVTGFTVRARLWQSTSCTGTASTTRTATGTLTVTGPATRIALTGSTTNLTAGATRVVTATIQDANGNTVTTGADSTLSVTFAKSAGTGTVTGLGSATAVAGVATITVTGGLAGSVSIGASATAAGGAISSVAPPLAFNVVAGSASKLAFTTASQVLTTGVVSGTITVQIQDAGGNPVNQSGGTRTVNLTSSSAGGVFRNTGNTATITSVTITNGNNAVSFLYRDSNAGTPTITAATTVPNTLTSATQLEAVNKAASTITLGTSGSPSTFGQSVTITATVTAGATGSVIFTVDGTPGSAVPLTGATASFSTSSLSVGPHSITAAYSGDANFLSSTTASALTQTVNKASTTMTVGSSANPATLGASVTFTASGLPSGATGSVEFFAGATSLGTGTVSGGTATSPAITTLTIGHHSITATYGGDTNYQGVTSSALDQVVNAAATTTILASSVNPSLVGQSVTFTATVSAGGGTVQFRDGINDLGLPVTLVAGTATYTTSALTEASHTITAVYSGDATHATSTGTVTQLVSSLRIVMYQVLCPGYGSVPANEHYLYANGQYDDGTTVPDATNGHTPDLNHTWQYATAVPSDIDAAAGCVTMPAWQFNLRDGSGTATPFLSPTTGSDGTVAVYLTATQAQHARSDGSGDAGIWVDNVVPAGHAWAGIRCFQDILYSDNSEHVYNVPAGTNEVYCLAYNVAQYTGLSITKTANPAIFTAAGDHITYTYTLKNTGNLTLTGPFTVTDNKHVGAISCGNSGTSIASGATRTCTMTYTILAGDVTAGSVTNVASATGNYQGAVVSTTEDATATVYLAHAELTLTKTANLSVYWQLNQVITYTYTLTNSGNVTLDGSFTVNDTPLGAISCGNGGTSIAPGANRTCTATHTVIATDMAAASVDNSAWAQGHYDGHHVDSARVNLSVERAAPAMTIVKIADTTTYNHLNQVINYTYTVSNTGNVSISALAVTDDNIDPATVVTCDATTLAPDEWTTCHAARTVHQADLDATGITNHATASGTPAHGVLAPKSTSYTVTSSQDAELTITKSITSGDPYLKDGVIHYSFKVENTGNVTLAGPFTVEDNKATDESCPDTDSLAPGAFITCTASYIATQTDVDNGTVTNSATATNGVVTSAADTATAHASQTRELTITKSITSGDPYLKDGVIHYSFKVENTGNVTLAGPFTVEDNKATDESCPDTDSLAPGAFITCTASYIATQTDVDNGTVTNSATATNGVVTSAADTATAHASQTRELTITKSITSGDPYLKDGVINYSFKVENTGNVTLAGPFTVEDNKATDESCPDTDSLAPGAFITCTASYIATQDDVDNGTVTNSATATNGVVTSAADTATAHASQTRELTITKSITSGDPYLKDGVIIYSFKVENTGNVTLAGPFTVEDNKATDESCPDTDSLAPGAFITCTASYTATQDDVDNGTVTNSATARPTAS